MKKILIISSFVGILALAIVGAVIFSKKASAPIVSLGSAAIPWVATSTTQGWISPIKINGVEQIPFADSYIASSTTATSSFRGPVIVAPAINNGCTTFMVGTTTPDPGCAEMVISKVQSLPSQSGAVYQAIKLQVSNTTTFVPTAACGQFVWNISFNTYAGAGRDMGAICANYDQAATSLGGRLRLYSRDHTSGDLIESLSIDGLHNVAIGTTTRMTPAQQPRFYVASSNNNTTAPLFQFDFYNGLSTSTRAILGANGFMGIGTSTVANPLTVAGIVNTNFWEVNNTSATVVKGDVVWKLKVSTADASGLTARDETASISAVADTADYAGVAAPTAWVFKTQNTAGTLAEGMRLSNAGFLGIGTTTPNAKLDIYTSSSVAALFTGSSGAGAVGIGATSVAAFIQAYTNDSVLANANLILEPNAGLVGIGTSTPKALIDGYTTASSTNMLLESTAGSATGGCFMMKDVGTGGGYTQVYAVGGVLFSKVATSLTTCN